LADSVRGAMMRVQSVEIFGDTAGSRDLRLATAEDVILPLEA
jgi:hypothetical protein